MNRYTAGQLVRITGTFRRSDTGALIDPTVVRLSVRAQAIGAAPTTFTVATTNTGVGQYFGDVTAWTPVGRWQYRWDGTGTGVAAPYEGEFQVLASDFIT